MASKILIKRSVTQGSAPTSTDLAVGELAVNPVDKRIYFKQPNNNIEYLQAIYASDIGELANVDLTTSASNGDALLYDSNTSTWLPRQVSEPLVVVGLDQSGADETTVTPVKSFKFDSSFTITDLGNGAAKIQTPPKHVILYQDGTLQPTVGTVRWHNPVDVNVYKIITRLTGVADQIVDIRVLKSGNPVKTILLPAGNDKKIDLVDIDMVEDDYLTVNIVSVGTNSSPGVGLSVEFFYVYS
jgi:hypothetical protein